MGWPRKLLNMVRRNRLNDEIQRELSFHIQERIDELIASGVTPTEARSKARRQFGNYGLYRERTRDMNVHGLIESVAQDLRICGRSLLRTPILALTIVVTVGLGIGATTVIFGTVHAALLRPLPYPDPDRLVRIYTDAPPNKFPFSVADFLALQAQQTQFEGVTGYATRPMAFSDGIVAERLNGRMVSWTYFGVLGIQPAIGRDFTEEDGRSGNPRTVIVSHGFWQRRLGGRVDGIGKAVRLDGTDYILAGVLPRAVGPLEQGQDFFAAAQFEPPQRKGPFFITVVGRQRKDTQRTVALDELRAINRRLFPIWRASYQDERASWNMTDLKTHVAGDVGTTAEVALAAVVLLWLIACANGSSLLVARVTSRRRELAVRAALGASRARIVHYLLVESGLVALTAAAVGIVLASAGITVLRNVGGSYFPRTQEISLDGPVLALLAGLTAASALLFGLIPALHGSGTSVDESLRAMGRSSTGSRSVRQLRQVIVGSQFAIATPLLIVAGLLLSSLNELGRVNLGFDSRNVLTAQIILPDAQYPESRRMAFWNELSLRLGQLPGVADVAFADGRPPNEVNNFNNFKLELSLLTPGQSEPVTPWVAVTPGYFRLLGLTLLEGRLLEERDALPRNVETVVVDRAWAKRFFPNDSPVGKRLRQGGCSTCPWTVVVGVVNEVKYEGLDKPDDGTVYSPLDRQSRFRNVVLRTTVDPQSVVPSFRQTVREIDTALPLSSIATIDDLVAGSLQRPQSLSLMVGSFALVALILSIIGIYGVMAYYVQQHLKDISIRMALGSTSSEVLRLVIGEGMSVVAAGTAIGLLTAFLFTRLISRLLFGVGYADALTYVGVTSLLLAVALVAGIGPARRASRLQPSVVLRND
jgi:putative ABC transport system permease protein